jgi:PTS system cellobiose-specific IIB component
LERYTILLVCGGGMSSGFLAQNIRKAAKNRSMDLEVFARSESEVEEYVDRIDVLLYGPHLKYLEKELIEKVSGRNIPISIIDQSIYGMIDGERTLDLILELIKEKEKNE